MMLAYVTPAHVSIGTPFSALCALLVHVGDMLGG